MNTYMGQCLGEIVLVPTYDYAEFLDHFASLSDGKERGEKGFEASAFRVLAYMKPQYSDQRELQFKFGRFMLIMSYLSENIASFDSGDLAVQGSPDTGALVGSHLLRAVHHVFATRSLAELSTDPTPAEIVKLATELAGDERSIHDTGF